MEDMKMNDKSASSGYSSERKMLMLAGMLALFIAESSMIFWSEYALTGGAMCVIVVLASLACIARESKMWRGFPFMACLWLLTATATGLLYAPLAAHVAESQALLMEGGYRFGLVFEKGFIVVGLRLAVICLVLLPVASLLVYLFDVFSSESESIFPPAARVFMSLVAGAMLAFSAIGLLMANLIIIEGNIFALCLFAGMNLLGFWSMGLANRIGFGDESEGDEVQAGG